MIRVRGSSAAGGLRVRLGECTQVKIERCALQVLGKSVDKGSDSVGNSTNPGHCRPKGAVKRDRDDVFAKKKVACVCFFLSDAPRLLTLGPAVCVSFLLLSHSAPLLLCRRRPFVPTLSRVFPPRSNFVSHLSSVGFFSVSLLFNSISFLFFCLLRWQSRQRSANSLRKCEWDTFERKIQNTPSPYLPASLFLTTFLLIIVSRE